ncbi:hypothetical protein O181_045721 [Austropuccinia psidii MF-1]|uniref:Reverse transcriptase/retrotransposon-derived protein RNase H-like domain-containing protein n=1 Tax=Austropuccinia psidii MF-1 TaxID=1389203 RepID=A0A9Q3HI01_9BASI|nr:hypothetical protein [Austropuccinia psidii MF-1]
MDQLKFNQILNLPPSGIFKDIQSFPGFASFQNQLMKNYSKKISSFTKFLKKYSVFTLNEESMRQLHHLKEAFTTSPIFSHFNPSLPTIVETGASDYALGAFLSQVSDSVNLSISFDSCKHIPAELNNEIH